MKYPVIFFALAVCCMAALPRSKTKPEAPSEAVAVPTPTEKIEAAVKARALKYCRDFPPDSRGKLAFISMDFGETTPKAGWDNQYHTTGTIRFQRTNGMETRDFEAVTVLKDGSVGVSDFTVK
jgi:hypothetical protein